MNFWLAAIVYSALGLVSVTLGLVMFIWFCTLPSRLDKAKIEFNLAPLFVLCLGVVIALVLVVAGTYCFSALGSI